ncbi:uncharacterized protein LOC129302733 [Prosopis cineraria]|uniref:uncharacterized protein LOC129302733 n=1 Tax=Prosopis cineraria TaxID=364024 RepID=UPI0024107C2A|nr:uncharacterized protein LOC129302733 [Prosopis cineraria]
MVALFHDMMHKEIEVYVDDMVAESAENESHLEVLRKLFVRLREYRLRLNPNKCIFRALSGKLLGFIMSRKGIEVDPDKVRAIQEMPSPQTEKEVRSFLGRLNYIARFIANLTATYESMFKLLKKNCREIWDDNCQKAFDKIKDYLLNPPILVPPSPYRPLILYLATLPCSMGAMLGQHDDSGKKERAIYFLSKKFNDCEARYPMIERTCCGLVWATRRLRQYMLYYTTWLISRVDPLKYIFESPHITVKGSAIADHLADNPLKDDQPLDFQFPNKSICIIEEGCDEGNDEEQEWKMYFDGAANMHRNRVRAVIISPEGKQFPVAIKLEFDCTNNIAEYEACVNGLRAAITLGIQCLKLFGDSTLIIHQVTGEWRTKDVKLIPYQELLTNLIKQFEVISFHHLTQDKNHFADALATLAVMIQLDCGIHVQPIQVEARSFPAYCLNVEEDQEEYPWFLDIKDYITKRSYPIGMIENEKKTLRRLAMTFFISKDVLYKRGYDVTLLRFVSLEEAKKIMVEVHEGICGTHANGHTMAK